LSSFWDNTSSPLTESSFSSMQQGNSYPQGKHRQHKQQHMDRKSNIDERCSQSNIDERCKRRTARWPASGQEPPWAHLQETCTSISTISCLSWLSNVTCKFHNTSNHNFSPASVNSITQPRISFQIMKINQLWNINFWGHKFQIKYCWKRMYDGSDIHQFFPKG
jgi:hypothetical protein